MPQNVSDEAFPRYVNQIGYASLDQIEAARGPWTICGVACKPWRLPKPCASGAVWSGSGAFTAWRAGNWAESLRNGDQDERACA